jgi:hypothetical protein
VLEPFFPPPQTFDRRRTAETKLTLFFCNAWHQ